MNGPEDDSKLLESLLPVIDKAVRHVASRMHLSVEDAQDLKSRVLVDLCKDDYGLLRAFRGESSWGTYLVLLVSSRAYDHRRKEHGKFRPSRMAERLGAWAAAYETLRRRDGLSSAEATRRLAEKGFAVSAREIESLEAKLSSRGPRKFESLEGLELLAAEGGSPEVIAREHESAARARKILSALRVALSERPKDEQLALRWRTDEPKVAVRKIAELLGWGTEKEAFRRLDRIHTALKKRFSELGVDAEEVLAVLADGWPQDDFEDDFEEDVEKEPEEAPDGKRDDEDES